MATAALYRTLAPGEWDEAMTLWVSAFGDVGWIFESLDAGTTGRKLEHTCIAEQDGQIVAAVDVFIREVRDEAGRPVKMGGIGSVATHADYRKQGHSGQLLKNAIELMKAEGCGWSMLFTGLHGHYGKYGWEVVPWRRRVGAGRQKANAPTFEIQALGNAGPWPLEQMAEIYDAFNGRRPLTHVRTPLYWQIPIRVRLELSERQTWVAKKDGRVVAYLVATTDDRNAEKIGLTEAGCLPGAEQALTELAQTALKPVDGPIAIRLPWDPAIDSCLKAVFEQVREEEWYGPMCREIAPDWSIDRIRKLTALPDAHSWDLDGF